MIRTQTARQTTRQLSCIVRTVVNTRRRWRPSCRPAGQTTESSALRALRMISDMCCAVTCRHYMAACMATSFSVSCLPLTIYIRLAWYQICRVLKSVVWCSLSRHMTLWIAVMALSGLYCADVPLSNYSLTLGIALDLYITYFGYWSTIFIILCAFTSQV